MDLREKLSRTVWAAGCKNWSVGGASLGVHVCIRVRACVRASVDRPSLLRAVQVHQRGRNGRQQLGCELRRVLVGNAARVWQDPDRLRVCGVAGGRELWPMVTCERKSSRGWREWNGRTRGVDRAAVASFVFLFSFL